MIEVRFHHCNILRCILLKKGILNLLNYDLLDFLVDNK